HEKEICMSTFNSQQKQAVDKLVEEYSSTPLNRREFIQRALAAGLSFSAASALLAACGGTTGSSNTPTATKSVDLLNVWGDEEKASFQAVVDPFHSQSGISVNVEG